MKKFLTVCVVALAACVLVCQESRFPKASEKSEHYRRYREESTDPIFGLAKVRALVKGIKRDSSDNERLAPSAFNRLSFKEKFTYTMIHGEDSTQNCDAMPAIVGEETKLFGHILGAFNDEQLWSDRQEAFLKNNRKKVIGLIRTTMNRRHRVGLNLKHAIIETQAVELIPDLIAIYNRDKKDHDILTVFLLLMKEDEYKPFLASKTYEKLYGKDSNYQAFISANPENQKLTIKRAMAFYKSQ